MSHKAGFVNIIGRPNAGKSTLMNKLVGERISIITSKVQTTRHRILGIVNEPEHQIVFSDTPGILDPQYKLQEKMMNYVSVALRDADIILLIVDVSDKKNDFYEIDEKISHMEIPVLILLNKIDLSEQAKLEAIGLEWKEKFPKAEVYPISALVGFNIDNLKQRIVELLPENPPFYPKDELTDKPVKFFVSEIIREKILENYQKEIPYSCEVEVESYKLDGALTRISAVIYVMRDSQKGILIGHKGVRLKKVGTDARKDIEKFIDGKVFLELHVKVDKDWRDKENRLKNFGYQS